MKPRNIVSLLVPIAIVAVAATSLRLAHVPPGTTEARAQTSERAAASDRDSISYYLLNTGELTTLAGATTLAEQRDGYAVVRIAPQSVIAIVGSPDGESRLRHTIDEANRQVSSYDEPGFRIVDLRPSTPADGGGIEGS